MVVNDVLEPVDHDFVAIGVVGVWVIDHVEVEHFFEVLHESDGFGEGLFLVEVNEVYWEFFGVGPGVKASVAA